MPTSRISYPAPRRETVPQGQIEVLEEFTTFDTKGELIRTLKPHKITTYTTKPWSIQAVLSTISAGGWFGTSSQHDFEPGASEFAQDARIIYTELQNAAHS